MAVYDKRKTNKELTYYVINDLDKPLYDLYRFDKIDEAISQFKRYPKQQKAVFGMSLMPNGNHELDIVQNRINQHVLINDYKELSSWKDNKEIVDDIDYLIAKLDIKYEAVKNRIGNKQNSVVVELERYQAKVIDPLFKNSELVNYKNGQPIKDKPEAAIIKALVSNKGWMSINDINNELMEGKSLIVDMLTVAYRNINQKEIEDIKVIDITPLEFDLLKQQTAEYDLNRSVTKEDKNFTNSAADHCAIDSYANENNSSIEELIDAAKKQNTANMFNEKNKSKDDIIK